RTGVIGGRRESKIAKLIAQVLQKFGGFRQSLDRIERIEQITFGGGPRHKLGDAQSMPAAARLWPDSARPKPAFPPDPPDKNSMANPLPRAADSSRSQIDCGTCPESWPLSAVVAGPAGSTVCCAFSPSADSRAAKKQNARKKPQHRASQ